MGPRTGCTLCGFADFSLGHCGKLWIYNYCSTGSRRKSQAQVRIIEGIITGIGFIGGGAILKQGGTIRRTATAASIYDWRCWHRGDLGYYEIAIVLSVVTFLTLRFLTPFGRSMKSSQNNNESSNEHRCNHAPRSRRVSHNRHGTTKRSGNIRS